MTDLITRQFLCESNSIIASYNEAVSEYNIQCKEIELMQLQGSILTESVEYLYEEAQSKMEASQDNAVKKFFAAIGNFIQGIVSKITGVIREKKADENIKRINDAIRNNPELASEKIEMIDLNSLTKSQQKHYAEVRAIISKQKSGKELSDSDIEKLTRFQNDDYKKTSAALISIPISAAAAAVTAAVTYCKTTGKSLGEVADDCKTFIKDGREKAIENEKDRLSKKIKWSKDTLANIGHQRADLLAKCMKNLATLTRRIDTLTNRDANMKDRLKNGPNIFVKGLGKADELIQRGVTNGKIPSVMPSRKRRIESYGEQYRQQERLKDRIESQNNREREKEQKRLDKLQRRFDKLSNK